jgi:hypothetical protein
MGNVCSSNANSTHFSIFGEIFDITKIDRGNPVENIENVSI